MEKMKIESVCCIMGYRVSVYMLPVGHLWLVVMVFVGDYYCGPPGELDQEPDDDWVKSLQDEGRAYQEWDEDADVDESGEPSPRTTSPMILKCT